MNATSDTGLARHLAGLSPYRPGLSAVEVRRRTGVERVVRLGSNESPLGPSPRALAAARDALAATGRYPDGPARALRDALAERHGVEPANIVIGNGSTDLIDLLARGFLGADENAVISEGSFARYEQVVRARNGRARLVPMRGHRHDLEAMAAAIDDATRLVFVASPNNPTGTWNTRDEIEALLDRLPPDVLLVLDQAYHEYVDVPEHPQPERWVGDRSLVVLRTFSKAYGLAGLRVGYGLAGASVVDAIDIVREPFNTNIAGQAAALAALDDQAHLREAVALNREGRGRLTEGLRGLGLEVLPSQGNFVLVNVAEPAPSVFERLLARGVVVRPTGPPYETWLRITVGLGEDNAACLEALRAALHQGGR